MLNVLLSQNVEALLTAALECSFYVAPEEPGLTRNELLEAGKRLGLQHGEMTDAWHEVADIRAGMWPDDKILPSLRKHLIGWQYLDGNEDPDYREVRAFDAVYLEWRNAVREFGRRQARLDRSVIVERAASAGVSRNATQSAIAILVYCKVFSESEGILTPTNVTTDIVLPSEQITRNGSTWQHDKPARRAAYPVVKEIIERRKDGRRQLANPMDAFALELEGLGVGSFRLWWTQLLSEYRQASRQKSPLVVTVLATALVEGALTFIVQRARASNSAYFRSNDFDGSPQTWKLADLIKSAAGGGDRAVFNPLVKVRADELVKARQRIHAGRMLADFPTGPIDLVPQDASNAENAADLVIGHILEWLRKTPL